MFSCNLVFFHMSRPKILFLSQPKSDNIFVVLPIITLVRSIAYWFSSNISNNISLADILLVTIIDTYINDKCIFINFYCILGWLDFINGAIRKTTIWNLTCVSLHWLCNVVVRRKANTRWNSFMVLEGKLH